MLEPKPGERPTAGEVGEALEGKWVRVRVRWRVLVAAVVIGSMLVASGFLIRTNRHRETVNVECGDLEVCGVDEKGQNTWEISLKSRINQTVRADLDGDRRAETIVATKAFSGIDERHSEATSSEVLIVDRNGRVLTYIDVNDVIRSWSFPFSKTLNPTVYVMDVDGNGSREVVVLCDHFPFFPSVLLVYWPQDNQWDQVLGHNGRIYAIDTIEVEGRSHLVFLAVNNILGMVSVFGEIELTSPRIRSLASNNRSILGCPPDLIVDSAWAHWVAYVPLAQPEGLGSLSGARLGPGVDGIIGITFGPFRGSLDQWRNPKPGPNEGADLAHEAVSDTGNEDLKFLLAHLTAIDGDIEGAKEILLDIISHPKSV